MNSFYKDRSSASTEIPLGLRTENAARVAADIEAYIRKRFAVPAGDSMFTRTVDLFEEGYIDSTGLVELIAHIEELYSMRLPEEALFDPAFSHIDGIAHVVAGQLRA